MDDRSQVSLAESELPATAWVALTRAFAALEQRLAARPGASTPLAFDLSTLGMLRVEQHGAGIAALLFADAEAHTRWTQPRQSYSPAERAFVRVWRAGADELFSEDVELLGAHGLDPTRHGAAVAVRLSPRGTWEDVEARDVARLVVAMRMASLRVANGGELAA